MLTTNDRRTRDQRKTHIWAVVARDNFLSQWGLAEGGVSRCCWATDDETKLPEIKRMIEGRKEMRYVSIVNLKMYRPPKGTSHFSIYVY